MEKTEEHLRTRPSADDQEPKLNYDILIHLLDFLDTSEMVPLMRTSKILFHEGTKRILSEGPALNSEKECRGFCRFVLADVPMRPQYLRVLYLIWEEKQLITSSRTTTLLTDMLLQCHNLEKLVIQCQRIGGIEEDCFNRLAEHSFSKLKELSILCSEDHDDDMSAKIVLLQACHSVLEELTITDLSWLRHTGPIPELRKLKVTMTHQHEYFIAFLAIICPKLTHLDWMIDAFQIEEYEPSEALRGMAIETQEQLANAGGRWHRLEHLGGDIDMLYESAITCQVDVLKPDFVTLFDNTDILYLRTVLNLTQPRHVILPVQLSDLLEPPEYPAKKLISTHPGPMELTLNVDVDEWKPGALPAGLVFTSIVRLFKRLRIDTFNLSFGKFIPEEIPDKKVLDGRSSAVRVRKTYAEPYAEQLAEGIPSLQHITFKIPETPRFSWIVERSDAGEVLLRE
ncbi:hypothetical protein CERSUDRAFT_114141 [Gelatoporia subvermispora B]|uniref:F-box domain-containing protein n=1 Tax=Ceriporiopsis subvermispora (strain B) TaxID=914234 RepID=M2RGC4_CERS8|nr:hypothetical protein CERSUDRAFT_114141 [Gelatoporia subvermispora B]